MNRYAAVCDCGGIALRLARPRPEVRTRPLYFGSRSRDPKLSRESRTGTQGGKANKGDHFHSLVDDVHIPGLFVIPDNTRRPEIGYLQRKLFFSTSIADASISSDGLCFYIHHIWLWCNVMRLQHPTTLSPIKVSTSNLEK